MPSSSAGRGDFEIATLFIALAAEEEEKSGRGKDEDEDENEVRVHHREPGHDGEADKPEPWRERCDDAPAVEKADGGRLNRLRKNPV